MEIGKEKKREREGKREGDEGEWRGSRTERFSSREEY